MTSRSPRTETITYLLALLLALGLRFILLGKLPLTDPEASLALQALKITQGAHPDLSPNIAYVNLTALLFFVFGSTNFFARFLPALAGSALALTPLLFRQWIRPRAAILLAFFLAIDPGLVALSRQAGSPIPAVTFSLLAVGFWLRRQPRLAGIFLALALLSGSALWAGLLSVFLAWMISHFTVARSQPEETGQVNTDTSPQVDTKTGKQVDRYTGIQSSAEHETRNTHHASPNPALSQRDASLRASLHLSSFVITLLLTSTLFLLAPQGLGAWLAALPDYLTGWTSPSSIPSSQLFLALGVYQLFGFLLAIIAITRGWMNGNLNMIRLSIWMLVALLLASFYPARQTADLVWALIPLWTLAALELSHHLAVANKDRLETAGVAIFTALLLGFAWMDFNAMYFTPLPSPQGNLRLGLLLGALLLLAVSVILVGYGWSPRIARVGSAWGATIVLGLYTLGSAWGATGLRNPNAVELWDAGPTTSQADLLAQTVDQISDWSKGQADDLPVTVFGVDSPALLWSLRNHKVEVVLALDPSTAPALVITPPQENLQLAAAYRGQDFNWRRMPVWDALPTFRLQWLTFHELPTQSETLILWTRDDLFIDSGGP